MSQKYYQQYGPMRRRRSSGDVGSEIPPPREPEQPTRTPRRSQRRRRSLVGPLLFLITAVSVALALPYATNLLASDQALQGVSVQGRPVGGMDRAALMGLLKQRYEPFLDQPLKLSFENHEWTPTLQQLGVRLDLEGSADAVVNAGRHGGPIQRVEDLWALWRNGLDLAPRLSINQQTLQAYLSSLAPMVEQPPRDAALSVAAGKVIPTPGSRGRQIMVDETAIEIMRAVQSLEPQTVVLRTRMLKPTLDDPGIVQAVKDAQALLSGPLTMTHQDRSWTWEPEKIAELLTITSQHGQMTIAVDQQRLERAVEKLAQTVDSGTVEPRVAFRRGRLAVTQPGQNGWKLEQASAVEAISATLKLPQRSLALPVTALTPQVTEDKLAGLGIVELVGEGKTSFAGSAQYRITNIKAGAARMDGVLIPPGEEFSFNTQLGAVDETNGFVQGYAVIGNRTQLEWGGGVCQDSTTVFRAAFWAGLPITERHAHPFYISWYDAFASPNGEGPGMDATIYTGVSDLKFINDTGHWLLIEAVVDEANQILTVQLYGTKPNRTVIMRGPEVDKIVPPPNNPVYVNDASVPSGTVKQTDVARRGMDIVVYRVISENGVEKQPELFFTRFKAWPNVFVRGTG